MEKEIKISIEDIQKKVDEKIASAIEEKLNSSCDNPIKDAINEEFKSVDGIVRIRVKELMKKVINDKDIEKELLDRLKNVVINKVMNR